MSRVDYRKIWEEHNQMEIPRDENGRSYEIHHIDGNRDNNHPDNLLLVSIKEHYKIHYEQGDWGACWKIAGRMGLSPEEQSEIQSVLMTLENKKRIENGTHPWLAENRKDDVVYGFTPESARKNAIRRVKDGTNPFLKENRKGLQGNEFTSESASALARERVENGTHHFGSVMSSKAGKKTWEGYNHNFKVNHPSKVLWKCEETKEINTKAAFTYKARKRLGLQKWPHKLTKKE